jgi:hypothetical protein
MMGKNLNVSESCVISQVSFTISIRDMFSSTPPVLEIEGK